MHAYHSGVPRIRLNIEIELPRQREHRSVFGEHPTFHGLVAVAPRPAHQAGQQRGGESAATPVFRHGYRELARLGIGLVRAHVLRATHDVDAGGRRDRRHERELAPRPWMHSALESGAVELLLVMHEAKEARFGRKTLEGPYNFRRIRLDDRAHRDLAVIVQVDAARAIT